MTPKEIRALFKRYMKVKDPLKAHAVLSASGSERWLGCPGSIKLSEGIPPVDNEHSIAGTHTHTLLQFMLENMQFEVLLNQVAAKSFKDHIDYTRGKHESALFAANYVAREKKRMGPKTELLVEQKLELEGVGFGTADIILYQPFGLLHIMDYKNGVSPVEPEENHQGLYYAYAAAEKFGWDFREVWITIIQPNAIHKKGPIRTWKTTSERLELAGMKFRLGAKKTKDPKAPLVIDSKWCYFCPAKMVCPKQNKKKETKVMGRFIR